MNTVESILLEKSNSPSSLFIFPTDIAASRWADHLLRLRRKNGGGGTVAMEQFIAWDTFKRDSIRCKIKEKKSIPSVLRKMFVGALVRENARLYGEALDDETKTAADDEKIFTSLIPAKWAGQADCCVDWITEMVPQLGSWYRQAAGKPVSQIGKDGAENGGHFSPQERDLYYLTLRYWRFLEAHGLFEPAWETPPFEDTGKECFIFFSESLSDFNEYRELLSSTDHVTIVETGDNLPESEIYFYTNARSEITEAALYITALHNNRGVSWDAVSVSVPDTESYLPYVLREFENRGIPYIRRSGKPLAAYPAGQFFTALAKCVSDDFSFSSLTALLLNRRLPWKDTEDIQSIIGFGIKNNCINSWSEEEGGREKKVNVWEDAFTRPFGGINPQARRFFAELKRLAAALRFSSSFAETRKNYFIFRRRFFDMDNCLPETDLVLSRCISELVYLGEIEKSYPDVEVSDPYGFFTGYLVEVQYLAQQSGSGVTILPYRTAAPAPFDCHIVLGASQENLETVFSPLAFLPGKRREKLGINENDASRAYINLHRFNSSLPAAFFCSEQTFSGYAIPHTLLGAPLKPSQRYGDDSAYAGKFAADLYREESRFASSLHFFGGMQKRQFPAEIHPRQKSGFEQWRLRRTNTSANSNTNSNTGGAEAELLGLVRRRFSGGKDGGKITVSATSLAPYFSCPLKWLFTRVLEIEDAGVEAGLMADSTAGQVYHAVLHLFLDELRKTGRAIAPPELRGEGKAVPVLSAAARALLAEKVEIVFDFFPELPGTGRTVMSMLTARLLRAEKDLFFSRLERFLAVFSGYFSGHFVTAAESYNSIEKEFYFLNGIVDCVLEAPGESADEKASAVIVDFKTGGMPARADCAGEELADFQLPMYLRLAEAEAEPEPRTALFFSITAAVPRVLFGTIRNADDGGIIPKKEEERILYGGEEFTRIMNEFDERARQFAEEINTNNFLKFPVRREPCLQCDHRGICRTVYAVCREKNNGI